MDIGGSSEPLLGTPESIIAVLILIALSGFFAGSETALTGVSKSRMHTLEKAGNKRAGLVNKIRKRKDNMIGALMLGNTAVHVLASAIAAGLLIRMFGEAGVLYASLAMTALVLIFGEVLPKTYALHHADKVSMAIAPLIRFVIAVFSPITFLITWTVRIILKMFGADTHKVSSGHHLEALRGAIDLYQSPDEEVKKQRLMLRSILDLFDASVSDIMIHRQNVYMIDIGQSVRQVIDEALQSQYSRLAVWRDKPENIVGVLHIRLLLKALSEAGGDVSKINLKEAMLDPWFIPDSTSLFDQLQAFRERKEHYAVVVDEYGTFMGIVTLEDVLEEIVGEIDDEVDENVAGVKRVKGGTYLADGNVTIRDLNREFDWHLPHQEYSTIAGLILYESETIPEPGQVFMFHGMKFEVLNRDRNRITRVRISPPPKQKAAA
jgi:Mg2+/Co2+ transporter CorB